MSSSAEQPLKTEKGTVAEPFQLKPLPPEDWPSIDHIVTEDGAPVDNVFSEKQMRLLTESLYASWKIDRPFVAFANVGLFYGVNIPPIVPDVLLSVGVRLPENLFPKLNRSYFVWAYGKVPEVVIEIVSNRQGGEDTEKLDIYANIRVLNYFIFDPEQQLSDDIFRGFRLNGGGYTPMSNPSAQLARVGLGLKLWHGRYEDTDAQWLRWVDADGSLIATGAERAEAEFQRAEAESQRAEAVARENKRLIELLRARGVDPAE